MANPNGNPGNKGGGRKSLYEEERMAAMLHEAFFEGVDMKKLKEALGKDKKKVKLFDVMLSKAFKSERIMSELMKKIYPDKLKMEGDIKSRITNINYIVPKDGTKS